jgi:signal recognition particle GTPase
MITLFGQHGVKDFEAWKRGAEENMSNSERNAQWGIVESSVYRMVDGSGAIVSHKFNNLEAAQNYKKMMESAESKAMLEQMGAKLPLTIWIAEEL